MDQLKGTYQRRPNITSGLKATTKELILFTQRGGIHENLSRVLSAPRKTFRAHVGPLFHIRHLAHIIV